MPSLTFFSLSFFEVLQKSSLGLSKKSIVAVNDVASGRASFALVSVSLPILVLSPFLSFFFHEVAFIQSSSGAAVSTTAAGAAAMIGSSTTSGIAPFLPFLFFLEVVVNAPQLSSPPKLVSGTTATTGFSITLASSRTPLLVFFFSFFGGNASHPSSAAGCDSGTTTTAGSSSTFFTSSILPFLPFFLSLPDMEVPQLSFTSRSNSGYVSVAASTFGVSSAKFFLPFFLSFLAPKLLHSSSTTGATGAAGGGGGTGGTLFSLPFFSFLLVPQENESPIESVKLEIGTSTIGGLKSIETSSTRPFFLLFFLSFLFTDIKPPPQAFSSSSALMESSSSRLGGSSCVSSGILKSPKSNPEVVVFFVFFLLPPKDHPLPSDADVNFESLDWVPVKSVLVVSVPPFVSHLLDIPHPPPHPPSENPEGASLVLLEPKFRSIFGAPLSRSISSKLFKVEIS